MRDTIALRCGLLTCFLERRAHSSKVSAASSFPWRLYRAPRFLSVVFTVGLQGEGCGSGVRAQPNSRTLAKHTRALHTLNTTKQNGKGQERGRERTQRKWEGRRLWDQEAGPRSLRDSTSDRLLTCSLCRPCTTLRTLHRACHSHGTGSGDENREMLGGR